MKVAAIIVGFGLSGLSIAEQFRNSKLPFVIIDSPSKGASQCAAGVYNPTILKRYTMSWEGPALLKKALPFYRKLESELGAQLLYPLPIARLFSSIAEQNQWMAASDKNLFQSYLSPHIHTASYTGINSPFGFGEVEGVGRLDIPTLLSLYKKNLLSSNEYKEEEFEYSQLEIKSSGVCYKGIEASHIIFCEGARMRHNPFFDTLPLKGSHGDMFKIKSSTIDTSRIWKSRLFLVPQGEDCFWVGASFNNQFKEPIPTSEGKEWLISHLEKVINVPYTLLEHEGQVRPTVIDRRPLVGTHPQYKQLHLLNGMGSRGVITAPQMGAYLFDYIYGKASLPENISITRFAAS